MGMPVSISRTFRLSPFYGKKTIASASPQGHIVLLPCYSCAIHTAVNLQGHP
jgi:hypothetical protein